MDRLNRRILQVRKNIAMNIPQARVNLDSSVGHRYFDCDTGETYSSITTKLGILSNPIFSDRKMNRGMEYLVDNFDRLAENNMLSQNNLSQLIEEAKEYPNKLFKEAGARGTLAHKYVEKYIDYWIEIGIRPTLEKILGDEPNYKIWSALRSFIKWSKEVDFYPIASELMVWSNHHKIAGTLDCIGMVNGELTVLDWKTSAVIVKSYYLQAAAYTGMFKELTRLVVKRTLIVKLDLKQGQSYQEEVFDQPTHYASFILCSKLHDAMIQLSTSINQRKSKISI